MNANNTGTNKLVSKLAETAVMVRVHVNGWSGTISDSEWKNKLAQSMGLQEGSMFGVYGKGIPADIKMALERRAKAVKDVINLNSQPFMDGGWRIMPVRLYPKVQELFNQRVTELRQEVEQIRREDLVTYCKALYGPNYKETFVPSEVTLKSKFLVSLKTGQISIGTSSGNFEGLDKETSDKIRKETEALITESYAGVIRSLVMSVGEMLTKLKETVKQGEKRVSLRRTLGTMTEGLKDILRFNLTRDPAVTEIVKKVHEVAQGMLEDSNKEDVIKKCSEAQELLDTITF